MAADEEGDGRRFKNPKNDKMKKLFSDLVAAEVDRAKIQFDL